MTPDRAQFRDARHYLIALASEAAAPALRVYARSHAHRAPSAPDTWRRGVILGAGHLGDVLYRTCSLERLHAGLPACEWTYLTTRGGAELLRGNTALSHVVVAEHRAAVARELADGAFDVALCTDNIQHHTPLLATVRAGIPNRVAFASKGLSGLATVPVRVPRASWPAQFRSMVGAITGLPATWSLRPRVHLTESDERDARAVWDALPLQDAPITVAVAVTTRQQRGVFPRSLFERIVRRALALEPLARILLTGSQDDAVALDRLATEVGSRAVVAPTIGVRAYVALLRSASAFLGSDSGPRHMANAAGIPVFFVRNLAVPEIEAGRYCETEVDLAPAGQYLDAAHNLTVLDAIDADAAAAAIVRAAREHEATWAARGGAR